jgi:hypothetical protein
MKAIKNALGGYADSISRKRNGNILIRRGFFYRHGVTAESLCNHIEFRLKEAGIRYRLVSYGEVWKPFKGGSTIANSSHWWVELTVGE